MLVSARDAALILQTVGVSRRHSIKALECGLAGAPRRSSASWLFDLEAVWALTNWPIAFREDVDAVCPNGLFIAHRAVDAMAPFAEQCRQAAGGWNQPPTRLNLRVCLDRHGPIPFVVTVAGFVVLCADIIDLAPDGKLTHLSLQPAGGWAAAVAQHRAPSGPGNPWRLHNPHPHGRATAPPVRQPGQPLQP
jgi:hypothetical protein